MQNLSIKTSWHSGKDFIYAIRTKEFHDFIDKWEIKEALPTIYPRIKQNEILPIEYKPTRQNQSIHKQTKISNKLWMVIFFMIAVIITAIILYFR